MTPTSLMLFATRAMENLGVRHAVTGSMASIYYGEMRTTNDVDIVVELHSTHVQQLLAAFPADDFYVSEQAVRQAIATQGQFNVIHPTSGLKIDFIIPADAEHDRLQLSRARRVQASGDQEAAFASPEDLILKKLHFYQMGGSDKHLRDIAGILKVSGASIDFSYINDWARKLHLSEIWAEVQQRSVT